MKETQYDAEITELEDNIKVLTQKLYGLKQKRAEETCEFQVGDKVVDIRGRVGEVEKVWASYDDADVFIRLYKKDGSRGLRSTEAYSWDKWEKSVRQELPI